MPHSMKRFICAVAVLSLFAAPAKTWAVSLSGLVLYAAHHDGFPNGEGTEPGNLSAFLWHTAPGSHWYGLGVWQGLPPDSYLRLQPLNAPNLMLEFPLADGENDFTWMG